MTPPLLLLLLFISASSSSSVEELTHQNSDFATRLFRAVCSRTDDNVLVSPFALSAGLTALLSGAAGTTQTQLLQGLSLAGLDLETLPGEDGGTSLSLNVSERLCV